MNSTHKIYCVFQPQGKAPKATHHNEDDAIREAKRLAEQNPGMEFYVMESIGRAIKQNVSYYPHPDRIKPRIEFYEDDLPF